MRSFFIAKIKPCNFSIILKNNIAFICNINSFVWSSFNPIHINCFVIYGNIIPLFAQ